MQWIQSATLYIYNGKDRGPPLSLSVSQNNTGVVTFTPAGDSKKLLMSILHDAKTIVLFIEFMFDETITSATSYLSHYDTSSPWTYRIALTSPRSETLKLAQQYEDINTALHKHPDMDYDVSSLAAQQRRYAATLPACVLQRHPQWGEIPNHKWYSDNFGAEYYYPWTTNKKSEEDDLLNS